MPFRQLDISPDKSLPDKTKGDGKPSLDDNLIIHGDNLHALKSLLPQYAGKVKCIYIDPPYNTGNEVWCYNDNVNAPLIKEWLKDSANPVDKEDLEHHDKWLCMMWSRLQLLRELLADEGVIFVSIDDNEYANLQAVMTEIFFTENFLENIVWKHTQQSKNDEKYFSRQYNHTLVYRKSDALENFRLPRTEEDNKAYSNPDNDPLGDWRSGDVRSPNLRETLKYDIQTPSGKTIKPPEKGWRWSKDALQEKIDDGEIIFSEDETKIIRKIYLYKQERRVPKNLWDHTLAGSTREATSELKEIFGGQSPFDTSEPTNLLSVLSVSYQIKMP